MPAQSAKKPKKITLASRKNAQARHIGILLYHGVLLSAVHGLSEQFTIANVIAQRQGLQGVDIRISHWQPDKNGKMLCAYDSAPDLGVSLPDIVLVPPSMQENPLRDVDLAPVSKWLAGRHTAGAVIGSVCAGSFLLAEAGLLDGRAATTHWQYAEKMASAYPSVKVDGEKLLIEDGDIITAGGMMSWTDLGLRIIHRLMGSSIMMDVARFMLVDPPGREQRYYSRFSPRLDHGDDAILKVQHWLQKNGAHDVTVEMMAKTAAMELRTFMRRFQKATGLRPTEYSQHMRIGKAREMLEQTRRSIEQISWDAGYADTSAFRKVFFKLTGLTPGDYRSRFAIK